MSFHDLHDLAAVAGKLDFCTLVEGIEAVGAMLLLGVLALLRVGP